jgi:competence ComEA-like helix-hairpin-helix protein
MRGSLLVVLSLFGCEPEPEADDLVRLEWASGDQFHVGAAYRVGAVKGETTPVALAEDVEPSFDEPWGREIVWTYQVVETGLVPSPGDELYPYAETENGVVSLSVLRAWVDASLNPEEDLLESNPVIYLVFREDRDRLAAVISFTDVDGERVEQAWSTRELGTAYGTLSQSMITAAPTYLAPFTTRYADDERTLENGSTLTTVVAEEGVVDAFFDDELGGGMVTTRYETDAPWPTWTESDNVRARLLSDDEITQRRASLPPLLDEPPPNFDYKAALRAAIDLDRALVLDEDTIDGGWTGAAYEGYRPWAGSWWPLAKAELVFGYSSDRPTISGRIKGEIETLKRDMDVLNEEIRGLSEGADKQEKVAQYKAKQEEVVQKLVAFYDDVRADLDGGFIVIEGGVIRHTQDGWSYEVAELSPFDKFALHRHLAGDGSGNPFYAPAWEILNQYNPGGGSWWGHCNGWSAAAILSDEPRESISTTAGGVDIVYTTADLKGLLTETHYSVNSSFYGARYYKDGDDISDLSPKAFHQLVQFYLRDQGVPMVFDTTANEEVWNFPAWSAELEVTETTPAGSAKINVNTATSAELMTLDGIGEALAKRIIAYREANGPFQTLDGLVSVQGISAGLVEDLRETATVDVMSEQRTFDVAASVRFSTDGVDETHVDSDENDPTGFTETYRYTLVTDRKGKVLSGTWANDREHPDFAWIPFNNPTQASTGGSENPYVPYGSFLGLVTRDLQRQ